MKERRIQIKLDRFATRQEFRYLFARAKAADMSVSELIRLTILPLLQPSEDGQEHEEVSDD